MNNSTQKKNQNESLKIASILSIIGSMGLLYARLNKLVGEGDSNIFNAVTTIAALTVIVAFIFYLFKDIVLLKILSRSFFIVLFSSFVLYILSLTGISALNIYKNNIENLFGAEYYDSKYVGNWEITEGKIEGVDFSAEKFYGNLREIMAGTSYLQWYNPGDDSAKPRQFSKKDNLKNYTSKIGEELIFESDSTAKLILENNRGYLYLEKVQ